MALFDANVIRALSGGLGFGNAALGFFQGRTAAYNDAVAQYSARQTLLRNKAAQDLSSNLVDAYRTAGYQGLPPSGSVAAEQLFRNIPTQDYLAIINALPQGEQPPGAPAQTTPIGNPLGFDADVRTTPLPTDPRVNAFPLYEPAVSSPLPADPEVLSDPLSAVQPTSTDLLGVPPVADVTATTPATPPIAQDTRYRVPAGALFDDPFFLSGSILPDAAARLGTSPDALLAQLGAVQLR